MNPKMRIIWVVLLWIVAFLVSLSVSISIARPSSDALPFWIVTMAVVPAGITAFILRKQKTSQK